MITTCAGLADPAPVLQTFFVDEELQEAYRLDALLTVVDAKHILLHLDEERPEGVENEAGALAALGSCGWYARAHALWAAAGCMEAIAAASTLVHSLTRIPGPEHPCLPCDADASS